MRWTHLIRFSPSHTGYGVYKPRQGNMPERLESTGDNVYAPGQTVAVMRDGEWFTKNGAPLEVLVRPAKGQPATKPKPHRVVVWVTEYEDSEEERAGLPPRAALCIPWVKSFDKDGEMVWETTPFRPTCDDVTRRIEQAGRERS